MVHLLHARGSSTAQIYLRLHKYTPFSTKETPSSPYAVRSDYTQDTLPALQDPTIHPVPRKTCSKTPLPTYCRYRHSPGLCGSILSIQMQNMFHLSHSRTSTFCLHTRAHGATITATRGEGQVFRTWWARVAALTAVAIGMVTVKCSFPLLVCPEPTLLSAFDLPFSAYARSALVFLHTTCDVFVFVHVFIHATPF